MDRYEKYNNLKEYVGSESSPIIPVPVGYLLVGNKLTNLLDKMRESNLPKGCKSSEKHTKRSYNMDFGFAIIIDFAMNTDKMNPAYLVGKVMDEIIKFQILLTFRKLYLSKPLLMSKC